MKILIKKAKRVGHGFRKLDNYRLRALLNAGVDSNTVTWQAAPATPIRGHSPRFGRRAINVADTPIAIPTTKLKQPRPRELVLPGMWLALVPLPPLRSPCRR